MNPSKLSMIVFTLGLFSLFSPGQMSRAATYYVDRNHASARDTNPGTAALPWATLQHAADTLVAGDTVLIRGGTYHEQMLSVRSGDPQRGHIVFSGYPGETAIIDGTGVTTGSNGVIITHDYIKLINLEITNWPANGIWAEGAGFMEISDCRVHHLPYAIGFSDGTHDFVLNRVTMHHFDGYGFDASPAGGADCYNGVFNDCTAHTARDPGQNVDGFALGHGSQHSFQLNRCTVYGVYDGFDISADNTTLSRCVARDCVNSGYKIWADNVSLVNCLGYRGGTANLELDWNGEPGTTTLRNCTFVDGGTFNIWVENAGDALHMYNCIVAGGRNIGLAFEQRSAALYRGDANIFHIEGDNRVIAVGYEEEFTPDQLAAGAWSAFSGQDTRSLVEKRLEMIFSGPENDDFHPMETGVALDNGVEGKAPLKDLEGNLRPGGAGYDIGAYEFMGRPVPPIPSVKANGFADTCSVAAGTGVSIRLGIDAGDFAGTPVDYWLVQVKPDGSMHRFDLLSGSFTPSATLGELAPTLQDQLRYIDETALLTLSPEPGNHLLYFGIDTRQDGELNPAELYFDALELSVGNWLP